MIHLDPTLATQDFQHDLVLPGESLPDPDVLLRDSNGVVCVDVETRPTARATFDGSEFSPWHCELLGVAVAVPGCAWYLPLRHTAPGSERFNLDPYVVRAWLRQLLRDAKLIVNHHLKFDLKHLALDGIEPATYDQSELRCTMLGAQLLDERESSHALKPLAERHLGMPNVEEVTKNQYLLGARGKLARDWSIVPADVMAPYACGDVERALRLAAWQGPRLAAEGLSDVYALECAVLRVLLSEELAGFAVDTERLATDKMGLLREHITVDERIEQLLGVSINPNSADELADVVANRLALPLLRRTPPTNRFPVGQPKFDDETLLRYVREFPQHAELFWNVRRSRRLEHVRTAFVEPYLRWHVDGRIHANTNQLGARTGRMSVNDPALQQVADAETWRGPDGVEWSAPGARHYFVPAFGRALLFADYSQIEYRFFAHYANAEKLVAAYRADSTLDMHEWAARVPLGGRLPRSSAKNVNFGLVYGMGQTKLLKHMSGEDVALTDTEALEILNTYYRELPELRAIQHAVGNALRARGYVRTILGRKRRAAANLRGKRGEEGRGLLPYQALNAICQGSSADLLKDRMLVGSDVARRFGGELLLTIHDELVFELPRESVVEAARALKPALEAFVDSTDAARLRVPIYVNLESTTTRWSEAQKLKEVA